LDTESGDSLEGRINEIPGGPSPRPSLWRRVGFALAVTTLALGASCAGCAIVGLRAGAEGSTFTASTISALGKHWDPESLIQRASPEMLMAMPPEKLRAFVQFVSRRLGSLKDCQNVQNGPWQVFVGTKGASVFTSHYCDCRFERGPGRVSIRLVRRSGIWKLVRIDLNSDLLVTEPPSSVR
jgi:hypothetical protein